MRVSGSSFSNLRTHRDGSRQGGRNSAGCLKRQNAIQSGAKIPPSVSQQAENKGKNGKISSHFIATEKFNNKTLNQIITLWLLRQAIPWNRVEDPYLRAAFHYCEPGASLFKRKWAATSGRTLYLELQEAMLKELKVSYLYLTLLVYNVHSLSYSYVSLGLQ